MAQTVRASFYNDKFEGRTMANGAPYHASNVTAASFDYPLGTVLRVQSVQTGRELFIPVTDRGPYGNKFRIDLSKRAFVNLGLDPRHGWGWVKVTIKF